MSGSNKIIVDSKKNISDEKLEISVKTFFGHEITVRLGGSYEVLTGGIKGLIDKILWFIYAPTLESRKAAVEKSLKDNNSQVNIDNSNKENTFNDLVNSEIEQKRNEYKLSEEECNEIRERMSAFKGNEFTKDGIISVVKDTIDQFIKEKYGNEDGNNNINNKLNINNHDKIYKDRAESGNMGNEFSIFGNEDNDINFVDGQNSARTDVNNMGHDNFDLSEQELNNLNNEIKKFGFSEEEAQGYRKNRIAEIKKDKKEKAEEKKQLENVIKQSESENENIEKKYKEAESNLKKMMPEGYRVTSFDKGDEIIGDGNCFYRAIAKLKNGNQEGYGEIRKTISDEINKSAELFGESADKIDNNLITLIQLYAGEYSELKGVEIHKNNLDVSLLQIREHVEGKDKKNEYAGPIEAYFYAKATKKAVIIYDSNNQISVFIPGEDGNSVNVKHMAPDKIESYIKKNNIDISNAVKLAYNAAGKHYEAVVPVGVDN